MVDTTQRQASEERRELISHSTASRTSSRSLRAKYVGTPHLSFSLSPQPLQQLSIDPGGPEPVVPAVARAPLGRHRRHPGVHRRLVVPRARLLPQRAPAARLPARQPTRAFQVRERFNGSLLQFARMVNYLNRTFPAGTPLEELDIDIIGGFTSGTFQRPVVELWGLRLLQELVVASVVSPGASAGVVAAGSANYKHFLEVWLDTLRDEYEREVSRSPLERGVLFGENRFLDTCFGTSLTVAGLSSPAATPRSARSSACLCRAGVFDIGGTKTVLARRRRQLDAHAMRWRRHALECDRPACRRPALQRPHRRRRRRDPAQGQRPRAGLGAGRALAQAAGPTTRATSASTGGDAARLGDAQRRRSKAPARRNLAAMATALVGAARVEEHNADVERAKELFRKRGLSDPPDPLKTSLSATHAASIVQGIGDVLVSGSAKPLIDAVLGAPRAAGSTAAGPGGGGSSRKGRRKGKGKGKG